MPARSRTRWAWRLAWCIRWPRCSRPTAWGSPTSGPAAVEAVEAELDAGSRMAAAAKLDALGSAAEIEVEAQGVAPAQIALRQVLHLKVKGTDTALPVGFAELGALARGSGRRTGRGSASIPATRRSSSRRWRPRRSARPPTLPRRQRRRPSGRRRRSRRRRSRRSSSAAPGSRRGSCGARRSGRAIRLTGPAVLVEPHTSLLVEPGLAGADHRARPCRADPDRGAAGAAGGRHPRRTR